MEVIMNIKSLFLTLSTLIATCAPIALHAMERKEAITFAGEQFKQAFPKQNIEPLTVSFGQSIGNTIEFDSAMMLINTMITNQQATYRAPACAEQKKQNENKPAFKSISTPAQEAAQRLRALSAAAAAAPAVAKAMPIAKDGAQQQHIDPKTVLETLGNYPKGQKISTQFDAAIDYASKHNPITFLKKEKDKKDTPYNAWDELKKFIEYRDANGFDAFKIYLKNMREHLPSVANQLHLWEFIQGQFNDTSKTITQMLQDEELAREVQIANDETYARSLAQCNNDNADEKKSNERAAAAPQQGAAQKDSVQQPTVTQLEAKPQVGPSCGYHTIINIWAIQQLLATNTALTVQSIQQKAYEKRDLIKPNYLSQSQIMALASREQLDVRGNVYFITFAENAVKIAGITESTQRDIDSCIKNIKDKKGGHAYFICNTGGHWVCIAVIQQKNKDAEIAYLDSLNHILNGQSVAFKIIAGLKDAIKNDTPIQPLIRFEDQIKK